MMGAFIKPLTFALLVSLPTESVAIAPCADEENGIPPSAMFFGSGDYNLCDSFYVPGATAIGAFTCWNDHACSTIAHYLGFSSISTCDEFSGLYANNGICDNFLNCNNTFASASESADCAATPTFTNDNTSALYAAPSPSEAKWRSSCDTSADNTTVVVRIYDFGEDGISNAGGSIGGADLMALQQAIIITLDPVHLPIGCEHTLSYTSDLFSHIHNYVVIYASNGNVLASSDFALGGTSVNFTLGRCGDGIIDKNEDCDDGNNAAGDGCSSVCLLEDDFQCNGEFCSTALACSNDATLAESGVCVLPTVTYTVDSLDDSLSETVCSTDRLESTGSCTLRAAIEAANGLTDKHALIQFSGVYTLTRELPQLQREMTITSSDDSALATIDANFTNRILSTVSLFKIRIVRIRLIHGRDWYGGAILSMGFLEVVNCVFDDNQAIESGGTLWTANFPPSFTDETYPINVPTAKKLDAGGGLWVFRTNVSRGVAQNSEGGGVENDGYAYIEGGVFEQNFAPEGGALHNCNTMDLVDATIFNNSGDGAGGVANVGSITITGVTIKANKARSYGGGLFTSDTCEVFETIITDNFVHSGNGGGVFASGNLDITGSSILNNYIGYRDPLMLSVADAEDGESLNGGGVYSRGVLKMSKTQLTGNAAWQGGALFNEGSALIDGCEFGRADSPNSAALISGVTYNSGIELGATSEVVLRGDLTTFYSDTPHENRLASCHYDGACGSNAECISPRPDGGLGVDCTCPESHPGGDPLSECRSPSTAFFYPSFESLVIKLSKPSFAVVPLITALNGMGLVQPEFVKVNASLINITHGTVTGARWVSLPETSRFDVLDTSASSSYAASLTVLGELNLHFNSTGLAAGMYSAVLELNSSVDVESVRRIQTHLIVHAVADPTTTTAETDVQAVSVCETSSVGELTVTIITRDIDGILLLEGTAGDVGSGSGFTISLVSDATSEVLSTVSPADIYSGIYTYTYFAGDFYSIDLPSGTYTLHTKLDGKPLAQAPVSFTWEGSCGEKRLFIGSGAIQTGVFLVSLSFLVSLVCAVWTWKYQYNIIVKLSQPFFLGLVLLGAVMSTSSVIPMGLSDDHYSLASLDLACMSVPWMYGLGTTLSYGAFVAKLRRVKKVMSSAAAMKVVKVPVTEALQFIAALLLIEITILCAWNFHSPQRWTRDVSHEDALGNPIESIGYCQYTTTGTYYTAALILVHLVRLVYANILCFQTRHLSTHLSESKWISIIMFNSIELMAVAIPLRLLVQDRPTVSYLAIASLMTLNDLSTVMFMFIPKMWMVHGDHGLSVAAIRADLSKSNNSINKGLDANTNDDDELKKHSHHADRILTEMRRFSSKTSKPRQNEVKAKEVWDELFRERLETLAANALLPIEETEALAEAFFASYMERLSELGASVDSIDQAAQNAVEEPLESEGFSDIDVLTERASKSRNGSKTNVISPMQQMPSDCIEVQIREESQDLAPESNATTVQIQEDSSAAAGVEGSSESKSNDSPSELIRFDSELPSTPAALVVEGSSESEGGERIGVQIRRHSSSEATVEQ